MSFSIPAHARTYAHTHTCTHTRLQRLELLASKFNNKATKVEAWGVGKDETLEATEDIEGSNLAEIMVSQCLPHLCIV